MTTTTKRIVFPAHVVGIRCDGSTWSEPPEVPAANSTLGAEGELLDPIAERERIEEEMRQAEAEANRAIASLATGLASTIASEVAMVKELVERKLDEATAWIVELATGLAGHVLRVELDAGQYDLTPAVRDALARAMRAPGEDSIRVRLNPADLAFVVANLEEEAAPGTDRKALRFDIDPALERGVCHVETSIGEVVHDPRQVLDAIIDKVRDEATAS